MADLARLPGLGALAMARALFKRPHGGAGEPFATAFALDAIDPAHVARYRRLLGFSGDALPVTYYYLLAQRAHLPTLLDARFPFRVAGLVHVENELIEHRPAALDAPMRLETGVSVDDPRPNGAVYCRLATGATGPDGPVFSCTSTYLAVRGKGQGGRPAAADNAGPPLATWQVGAASGRAYAAVSGDWNPIHLWRWSARLFGMCAPIIHGMHTMATACALLEAASGRRVTAIGGRFRSPAPLGASLALHASLPGAAYSVRGGSRMILEGSIAFDGAGLTSTASPATGRP